MGFFKSDNELKFTVSGRGKSFLIEIITSEILTSFLDYG